MKSLSVTQIFFIVLCTFVFFKDGSTRISDDKRCITENGIEHYGKRLSCLVACLYHKDRRQELTLRGTLRNLVRNDTHISELKRTELYTKLNDCIHEADDNDCELLNCVNIKKHPFSKIIFLIHK